MEWPPCAQQHGGSWTYAAETRIGLGPVTMHSSLRVYKEAKEGRCYQIVTETNAICRLGQACPMRVDAVPSSPAPNPLASSPPAEEAPPSSPTGCGPRCVSDRPPDILPALPGRSHIDLSPFLLLYLGPCPLESLLLTAKPNPTDAAHSSAAVFIFRTR